MKPCLRSLILAATVSILLAHVASGLPTYPEPGYGYHRVPLIWLDTGESASATSLYRFEHYESAADELRRHTAYSVGLPPSPRSGKLYAKVTVYGDVDSNRSNNPIIEIYGAAFTYSINESIDDESLLYLATNYAFSELADSSGSHWAAGLSRSSVLLPEDVESDTEEDKRLMQIRSTHRVMLEFDFDENTWNFFPSSESDGYPMLPEKDRSNAIFRKQTEDNSYVAEILFSESPTSGGSTLNRGSNMSEEERIERMRKFQESMERRRAERDKAVERAKKAEEEENPYLQVD